MPGLTKCIFESYSAIGRSAICRNEGKSAASFCLQVAAWVSDMFCNFYLLKNHKIADNSIITEARQKNKHRFGILRIFFMYVWLNLKTIKFYLIKLDTDFYWLWEKRCFQNKSKFITEEYFSKHINIKTKLKH